ncbi:type II toxin-antitoxin system HipA family toxin [Corynebacterium sp. UBA2622]|uniref:type II toxin-antitoxin system HipA family toxin n=1 Tax=Corynebacterium sp. UBA2622 TaxID=1946393 RepID=UPI0025BBC0A8|nr:HipA domain-containing protein [Corynebacterium sp. UBA2622]
MSVNDSGAIHAADIYVGDELTAAFYRRPGMTTEFRYLTHATRSVATSLPLHVTATTHNGSLPPFFTNLLPEGRRLTALRKGVKTSLDDELGLLLAVGGNTVGDVTVVPPGGAPQTSSAVVLTEPLDFGAALTSAGIADPAALPGVQDKASARTIAAPVSGGNTDYILKVSPPEYPALVENEAECFAMIGRARRRFPVASVDLRHDRHGRAGLLVRRFDRLHGKRLHVEDAAQIMGLYPAEKYSPSMEDLATALSGVSASPTLTARSIAFQTACAWLTGNGDLHAKNLSLMDTGNGFQVSPLYDIPSTLPYGDTSLALSVQGARDNISSSMFRTFCAEIGLPPKAADRVMHQALEVTEGAAERLIAAIGCTPRQARDVRRVLGRRRKLWGAG